MAPKLQIIWSVVLRVVFTGRKISRFVGMQVNTPGVEIGIIKNGKQLWFIDTFSTYHQEWAEPSMTETH